MMKKYVLAAAGGILLSVAVAAKGQIVVRASIRGGFGNRAITAGKAIIMYGFRGPMCSRRMNAPSGLKVTGTGVETIGCGCRDTGTTSTSKFVAGINV
jgi:hypothetical protein